MTIAVERSGDAWTATHAVGGRTLSMTLTFTTTPNQGAEVLVASTGSPSPFFSKPRIVAEAMQGVGQAFAEAKVDWYVSRIGLRDSDAPAPAQALYLACAIARAAVAGT